MIDCVPFDLDHHKKCYIPIIDILGILSTIIHVYTMYAIVFRSISQMRTYRWYLLWHQIVSFCGDFWVNTVTKPIVFIPVPIGYLTGFGEGIIHPKIALAAGQLFVITTCITLVHLILYRYFAVTGVDRFPVWSKLLLAYNYTIPMASFISTATATSNSEKVLAGFEQEYSCITSEIISIPHVWAYDQAEYMKKTFLATALGMINYAILLPYFVYATFKAINVKIMSETTRRMQRKFLIQLVLQASIPMVFVMGPTLLLGITMVWNIFGVLFLNAVLFIGYALFGVSGAVVLLVMVPSYHGWLYKLKSKSTVITQRIDIKASPSAQSSL